MKKVNVNVVNKSKNPLPKYETIGAAGMDLSSNEDIEIAPSASVAVKTGLFLEIPEGYEVQIRPRSGLSAKTSMRVANSPGTIDSDYRGELCILMWNTGSISYKINAGDRIAQAVLCEVPQIEWNQVFELCSTERGVNGFGSTGK